jgi:gliding motility-associated lipoprotein GldH
VNKFVFFSILSFILIGCQSDVLYEQNIPVNAFDWEVSDTLKYEINIDDTTEKYDLSVNIRHRDIYDYTNLYLKIQTMHPTGEVISQVISLPLSDEEGKWLGKCSGDICFNRVYLMKKIMFKSKGKYKFYINQEMRQDHLKNILDIGLKIEKSKQKKYSEVEE